MLTKEELQLVEQNAVLTKDNKQPVPIPIDTSRIKQIGTRGGSHGKYSAHDMASILQSYGISAKPTSQRSLLQILCHLVANGKITKDDVPPETLKKPLPRWLQVSFNDTDSYVMSKDVVSGKSEVFVILHNDKKLYFDIADAAQSREEILDFIYEGDYYHTRVSSLRKNPPRRRKARRLPEPLESSEESGQEDSSESHSPELNAYANLRQDDSPPEKVLRKKAFVKAPVRSQSRKAALPKRDAYNTSRQDGLPEKVLRKQAFVEAPKRVLPERKNRGSRMREWNYKLD